MKKFDFCEVEKEVKALWKKIGLITLLNKKNSKGEKYFLLDGPPYANYVPHVGHIRNTVYKDLYIKWNFMKGKNVFSSRALTLTACLLKTWLKRS